MIQIKILDIKMNFESLKNMIDNIENIEKNVKQCFNEKLKINLNSQ